MATHTQYPSKTFPTPTMMEGTHILELWRVQGSAILRIAFGIVWAIDAYFKFLPDFINNFTAYLTGSLDGQPGWVQAWIHFWIRVVKVDPHVFAHLVAFGEAALALALIVGAFSNLTAIVGMLLSMVVWSTAEGFGGPYVAGSTDIGSAIIYVLVFAGLFLSNAGMVWGVDPWLTERLGRFDWLASAMPKR